MNKKLSLAVGILSIICLGAAIFVCTVEQSVSNFVLAGIFFIAAVYFIYQYRISKIKERSDKHASACRAEHEKTE